MSDLQGLPPYQRIAAQIIKRITDGELQPGEPVPSVRELMETENVSRATAARVPGVLRSRGYAVATPGVGTIVTLPTKLTAGADRFQRARRGGESLGDGETVEQLGAGTEAATREVADGLGLAEGDEVAWRRRRYIDSGGVVAVSTTWISKALADVVPEFLQERGPLPKMTFGLIEDKTGRRAVKRRDTVEIREVPEEIAPHLEVDAGTDSLVIINHYWDQRGEPTEFAIDWHGRDRSLSMERDYSA
ncbi:GntR family transcriptional regulator [Streptomyces smyrnaeus]|uniref:GntR family transcriptional regulator n=1 Tax=Streptomyces smyrnaeus TaxID=1387713 RepID=UPI00340E5F65